MYRLLVACLLLAVKLNEIAGLGEIIYALNAGGESFTDSHGIRYRRDYLTVGTASDYGRMVSIRRMNSADKPLYETERYATETFGYSIPMPSGDGDYVLWLKFSEVWFNAPNQKVFDVSINDEIVVANLDIFDRVGRGVAHDEVVPFQIRQNKIILNGKAHPFSNEIRVEFVKGPKDNPKINALVVMRGTPDQVPRLPDFQRERTFEEFEDEEKVNDPQRNDEDDGEDEEERENNRQMRQKRQQMNLDEEAEEEDNQQQSKRKSKQFQQQQSVKFEDPYEADESSYIVPILVAVGAFIPLLFCLCKL